MIKGGSKIKNFILFIILTIAVIGILFLPWSWRMIYPLPYRDLVFANAQEAGVDPYLVMAVIRVESKFRPQAQSIKGAKGLMQLMPETARWAKGHMGEKYDEKLLFDVDYNTRIGTWYLAYLINNFDGELAQALAAYNGGPNNVKKWLEEGVWDGRQENILNIPFPETREFVGKVLNDYDTYRQLYSWLANFGEKGGFLDIIQNRNPVIAEC